MKKKKILFLTGTRADYGKIKPLLKAVEKSEIFELSIYVTGMHLMEEFGYTYHEIEKDAFQNIHVAHNFIHTPYMSYNLGNEICGFTNFVVTESPDLIIVHGDRIEALAGATVGALNNIPVAHIEGGEISGTIDDSLRHAISKLAHFHFVSTTEAKSRLLQLGENESRVFLIGSPDIDVMQSSNLPLLEETKKHYNIDFDRYCIMLYHPVTTEVKYTREHAEIVVESAIASGKNFVVIYPNNDIGSEEILDVYKQQIIGNQHFRIFPSIRFEYFLTLLKHAECIYGNSSAGIREAGVYGVPTIDVGTRQQGRYSETMLMHIQHVQERTEDIQKAFQHVGAYRQQSMYWGKGNSTELFMEIISDEQFWTKSIQKIFVDRP